MAHNGGACLGLPDSRAETDFIRLAGATGLAWGGGEGGVATQ